MRSRKEQATNRRRHVKAISIPKNAVNDPKRTIVQAITDKNSFGIVKSEEAKPEIFGASLVKPENMHVR